MANGTSPAVRITDQFSSPVTTVSSSASTSFSYGYYTFVSTASPVITEEVDDGILIRWVELFLAVIFLHLTVLTIVGNFMALTIFTRISVTKTVSVIFFTSMALADLANGFFIMPFSVYSLISRGRDLDTETGFLGAYCTFSGIMMNTTSRAALFTLILICFDRFLSVYDALHVNFIMTVKNCLLLVFSCWIAALLIAIFPFLVIDKRGREHYFENYDYSPQTTQCNYQVLFSFDLSKVALHMNASKTGTVPPSYVIVTYIFLNILPIFIPTYLIVFFCTAVIVILKNIFKNSKRLCQQVEPPDLKRNRSFRNSTVQLRSLSFKRKAAEKPVTTQINKVDAGYTEIYEGQGTASDHLEGEVVLRRTSRKLTQPINVNCGKSPQLAKDRWSQISVKSLQKRTKADHQKKAITTVVMMLLFFLCCYILEWFCIIAAFLNYTGVTGSRGFTDSLSKRNQWYFFTLTTIMKYINCAGNPFLYYFRMQQFQKEVKGLKASWNGTTNRIQTSGSPSNISRPSRPTSGARDSYRLSDNLSGSRAGSFRINRGSFTSSYKGTPTLRGSSFKRLDGTPGSIPKFS